MYLKEIETINYGAIKNLKYSFPFDTSGNPLPVILIGKNGTGKTLVLSNILHSLIENKRTFYNNLQEVSSENYYRVGSPSYIRTRENYSYNKLIYTDNSQYIDLMVKNYSSFIDNQQYQNFLDINYEEPKLKKDGHFNRIIPSTSNVFSEELFLYFPVERYYIPTWENSKNEKLKFVTEDNNFVGISKHNIVQYNLLNDIETWILDVVIDKMLYEKKTVTEQDATGKLITKEVFVGKNNRLQESINKLISLIFKRHDYSSFRIGISNKVYRKIVIIGIKSDGSEDELVSKFSNLSSGEIMILGIFATILKEYDRISANNNNIQFESIRGIVIIDEIDIHLHSDLAKEVLPILIQTFPKIQFIISSHSPFFLLGMRETFSQNCQFVALPTGTIMDNIDHFDEIKKCYSIIDENYENILSTLQNYKKSFESMTKPLIITEGKTDWKHLKHALEVFHNQNLFMDLDLHFLDITENLGDSKLENLLKNLAKVPHSNVIIGIFDNDTIIGNNYLSTRNFGNNVFARSIEDTQNFGCPISIEMLYSRQDIMRTTSDGKRIFLSDEFTEKSHQLKNDPTVVCMNNAIIDAYKKNTIKIIDSNVFDSSETSLALSKEMFAENILNQTSEFSSVDVNGFNPIFQIISSIVTTHK